jgi:hypothetical protein
MWRWRRRGVREMSAPEKLPDDALWHQSGINALAESR